MSSPTLFGHEATRDQLTRAFRAGRLPQVLLVTGAPGVGKQSFGRWLAGLLLCQTSGKEPCGNCQACRLAGQLAHPDFHWFVPIPRPKAGDPDKQVDEVQETLGELMAARRVNPVYGPPDGMAMHGVASARLLLRVKSLTTSMGGRRVILLGDADRLVPQESSQEAANALLKFLEEPPQSTIVILTTTDPTRVLPTIRSRAVPLRLGRLDPAQVDAAVRHYLPALDAGERARRVAAADGSIGAALTAAETAGAQAEAEAFLALLRQAGPAKWERILRQGPWQARGDFSDLLEALSGTLGSAARATATGQGAVPPALADVESPDRFVAAIDRIDAARESARGNVNPQLLLATLTSELAEALWH
ncbi:MAG: ATP-binding protein [Gemmatimonadales bacterium]